MSIHERQTKKGRRYVVRLRAPDGRGYKRTFRTKKEAESYEASERTDRNRGKWIDPRRSDTTFAEWAALWLTSNPAKRPRTLSDDRRIIDKHLNPTLGTGHSAPSL